MKKYIAAALITLSTCAYSQDPDMQLRLLGHDLRMLKDDILELRHPGYLQQRELNRERKEAAEAAAYTAKTQARIEKIRLDDAEGHARRQAAFDAAAAEK